LENELKARLGSNFNSVRKAWLELGAGIDGSISSLELAQFLGGGGQKNFDYALLEILVKMRTAT
jgi:hypothetical protein